jgi:uncharacterized iron-regulated membrane protein
MAKLHHRLRRGLRRIHVWLGLVAGVFLLLMGLSGGMLAFRPQITRALLPKAVPASVCTKTDWDRAQSDVELFAGAHVDRIYFPEGDNRVEFRLPADGDKIFQHVIYESCSGRILGTADLAWMDWLIDFHHNLRAANTGRQWAGLIGLTLFVCVLSGFVMWLCSGPNLRRAFRIQRGKSILRPSLDLHRSAGLLTGSVLLLSSATGIWLCYPATLRALLFGPSAKRVRMKHEPESRGSAGLNAWIQSAQAAITDGVIREIRFPERGGPVQIRMHRPGDFRSTGDNLVLVNTTSAKVVAVNLYASASLPDRLSQIVTGLHYADWGNGTGRFAIAVAGLLLPLVLVSGSIAWWLTRPRTARNSTRSAPLPAAEDVQIFHA